ncbi:MAG: hypothetical protein M1379_01660 [Firmicutes bacterium]|nr:hypothetical protein [Bacillota bacterium]
MGKRVVTLYLQDEEYEFLRAYAYEQRKSMSAVLKECLEGLRGRKEMRAGELPELCHEANASYASHRGDGMDGLLRPDQEQALVHELGKATESFLRAGILSSLTGYVITEPGSLRLSDEIIANREELRES